jgi:phosphohistidine swiveling domain-containing protein
MENHYFKTKLIKMGRWKLFPLDCETWFSREVDMEFEKAFGVPKALLMLFDLEEGFEHAYCLSSYFDLLYRRIDEINSKDYRGLEKKLRKVYPLKKKSKKELSKIGPKDASLLSNEELANSYIKNRKIVHSITVYDQFGWLAEEYWTPKMESVLVDKLKIEKGSGEYHRVIFALTKPEEISSTLEEKREVIAEVIKIKKGKSTIEKSATKLAKDFGWMPVFVFGTPWNVDWYKKELSDLSQKDQSVLENELLELKNYSKIRNSTVKEIVKKYKISKEDLQIFIDFGLALDGRNEAEYVVSFAGFYSTPMLFEIAKRLGVTTDQIRYLYENELLDCLNGKSKIEDVLKNKNRFVGYGYDALMKEKVFYTESEAKELFDFCEANVKNVQGEIEHKGVCASPGKAIGKARIVHSPAENGKVEAGDILITHATTVDYLPAMKKAAAIITEVGGLTCHAAVVSREFGIPCVVALKNAMKNFKDGEMIEVNADRGLVKSLKP